MGDQAVSEGPVLGIRARVFEPKHREILVIRQLASKKNRSFFQSLVRSQTKRTNLGLFSLYETSLFKTKIWVIGIAGRFIPLTDMDKAVRELEQSVISPSK